MIQLKEYKTFRDLGYSHSTEIPASYNKIHVHLVHAVKHYGCQKAELVANGNLTGKPFDSIYCGVVSLKNICLVALIAELSSPKLWATDIGNTYFEAMTKERLAIYAGTKLKQLERHVWVIHKALYGLQNSG